MRKPNLRPLWKKKKVHSSNSRLETLEPSLKIRVARNGRRCTCKMAGKKDQAVSGAK